jgi:nitrate reductase gamma subunit
MKILGPIVMVLAILFAAWVGTSCLHLYTFFGIVLPYAAIVFFIVGVVIRVVKWGKSDVPFAIPTTGGQQKSLPWIKQAKVDNPFTYWGVVLRMALEVLTFRSLFRGAKTSKTSDGLHINSSKWLWLGALAFHWSMFIIVLRHLRLFLDPVPAWLGFLEAADGFFQIGLPIVYLTDVLFAAALVFLFFRRVVAPRIRYISQPMDYFPVALLLAIAGTGIVMRYGFRIDVTAVKDLTMGLVTFHPVAVDQIAPILYMHLTCVSVLLMYFPGSKLMHAVGIFFSPTRNLPNNSRAVRHVNPWNYPVKVHSYAEYEEEFGEKMKKVGLPLDGDE